MQVVQNKLKFVEKISKEYYWYIFIFKLVKLVPSRDLKFSTLTSISTSQITRQGTKNAEDHSKH